MPPPKGKRGSNGENTGLYRLHNLSAQTSKAEIVMTTTPTVFPRKGGDPVETNLAFGLKKHVLVLLCMAIALFSLVISHHLQWPGAGLAMDPKVVLTLLSPLLLIAGFIERVVEILISPWRDAGATILGSRLDALKSQPIPSDATLALELGRNIAAAEATFQTYKGQTQQFAFCASITMSLGAAIIGVRALWPFLPQPPTISSRHLLWFKVFDVALSACLLAGGADGIHSVINMFTTFFDTTAQKTQTAANSAQTQ
jgi:hypothetical protein